MLKKKLLERAINDKKVNGTMIKILEILTNELKMCQCTNFKKDIFQRKLGISRSTSYTNLKKLEELGYIKFIKDEVIEDRVMLNIPFEKITLEKLLELQEKAYNYTKESKNYGSESSPLFITTKPKEKNNIPQIIQ